MRKLTLLFALLSCLSFISHAQRINVSPAIVRFSAGPADAQSQKIALINNGENPQILQIANGDWFRDEHGEHNYLPVDSIPQSCSNWLSVSHDLIEVPAESTVEITLTISPPSSYKQDSMKWAMLFIKGVVEKADPLNPKDKLSTTIKENFQFGIHVYNTPASLTSAKAEASNMELNPEKNAFLLEINNTGKTQIKGSAQLAFVHLATGDEFDSKELEAPIFPGYSRIFKLEIPKDLPKGEYSVMGLFDYGEDYPIEGFETSYTIE